MTRPFHVAEALRDRLEKRLFRFRKRNPEGWHEVCDPRPREARYLYRLSAVAPLVRELASLKASAKRPSK